MIQCPQCKCSLPDWATSCQFCKADTSKVARPVVPKEVRVRGSASTANWIWPMYYVACGYFILNGTFNVLASALIRHKKTMFDDGGPNIIGIILGTLNILFGLGLLFKIEFVRGVANFLCFLSIAMSLLSLVGMALSSPLAAVFGGTPFVLLMMFFTVLSMVFNGLMIYLIGETD